MPELPDVTVYVEALARRVPGRVVQRLTIRSPFVLRTAEPPAEAAEGRVVAGVERVGKRIVLALEGELFLVIHLMIAGRLAWRRPGARPAGRIDLAALAFETGTLVITEASQEKRASLHVVEGRAALRRFDRGGIDPLGADAGALAAALRRENRTLKRALTSPDVVDGIGNAYSDEILHAARLSPVRLTRSLSDEEVARLHGAMRETLAAWIARLRRRFGLDGDGPGRFPGPGQITAFRPEFAVHGQFGRPCPVCGHAVRRIVHAQNETNYCPACQTGGRVLADRSLSRLLGRDWPRSVEEWESPGGGA